MLSTALRAGLVALTLAATAAPALAGPNAATRWAPFDQGNKWVLREQTSGTTREIRCDYAYGPYSYVTGLFGADVWFGYASASATTLWVWNGDQGGWYPAARFGVTSPRTKWRFDLSAGACDKFDASWTSSGQTIATPAGTFTNCRSMKLTLLPAPNVRCAPPAESEIWWAPTVGIVKVATPRGEVYELDSAIVGNASYPPALPPSGQLVATVSTDQPRYVNHPNTIRCIRAPCPSNEVTAKAVVTFTVTNNTNAPVALEFSSGCQFDLEILDQRGKVMTALLDQQACTMALTQYTLQPRHSKSFSADIELKDRNGRQLDGTYTVRGRAITAAWSQVAGPDATAPVDVAVQP